MKKVKFVLYLLTAVVLAVGAIEIINLGINATKAVYNFIDNPTNISPSFSLTVPRAKAEPNMKEWVKKEVENAGINWNEVDCLIKHESGWDNWKYGINNDGSTDFGLWQINSIHKETINVEGRWDYKTATKWAIEKRIRDRNWHAWVGYVNNCR